ncbi:MAG: hypothetical protein Q9200_007757 [Gallowayella weberi]
MASPASKHGTSTFTYPFATSPNIIRSNQKDAFFTSTLTTHLSAIIRRLYGQRFTQTHTSELSTFSELLYLSLTTFIGNRTLGEEYCDIIQVQGEDGRAPAGFTGVEGDCEDEVGGEVEKEGEGYGVDDAGGKVCVGQFGNDYFALTGICVDIGRVLLYGKLLSSE